MSCETRVGGGPESVCRMCMYVRHHHWADKQTDTMPTVWGGRGAVVVVHVLRIYYMDLNARAAKVIANFRHQLIVIDMFHKW